MKTSDLTGALLDYWTARAEGVPADQLEIRVAPVGWPSRPEEICVRRMPYRDPIIGPDEMRMQPSTSWAQGGPLLEKHGIAPVPFEVDDFDFVHPDKVTPIGAILPTMWGAFRQGKGAHYIDTYYDEADGQGDTPLIAICRAVVRAAFGDEVEDLPC